MEQLNNGEHIIVKYLLLMTVLMSHVLSLIYGLEWCVHEYCEILGYTLVCLTATRSSSAS